MCIIRWRKLSISQIDTRIFNFRFWNLSGLKVSHQLGRFLSLGPKFIPTPNERHLPPHLPALVEKNLKSFHRALLLHLFFGNTHRVSSQSAESLPYHFVRLKNPSWFPPVDKMNKRQVDLVDDLVSALRETISSRLTKFEAVGQPRTDHRHLHRNVFGFQPNHLHSQRKELNVLLRRNDVIVCEADKNMGYCLVTTQWYQEMVDSHLLHSGNYQAYDSVDAGQAVLRLTAARLRRLLMADTNHLRAPKHVQSSLKKIRDFVLSYLPQPGQQPMASRFRILPKVHKPVIGARPIVAAHSSLFTGFSAWLSKFLKPYVEATPTYVRDSTHFLILFEEASLSKQDKTTQVTLVSSDVANLYGNADISIVKKAIHHAISSHDERDLPYSKQTIMKALDLMLSYMFVTQDNRWFRQLSGIAMGTNAGPDLAILFMDYLEKRLPRPPELVLHVRYIDDIFMMFVGDRGLTEARSLVSAYNSLHPYIRLESELSSTGVDFLDIHVYRHQGRVEYRLHVKPTNLHLYIPYTSLHPYHSKSAWIKSELSRIARNSSRKVTYLEDKYFFYDFLRARGYPSRFLQSIFENHDWGCRVKIFERTRERFSNSRAVQPHQFFVSLPFHPMLARYNWSRDLTSLLCQLKDAYDEWDAFHSDTRIRTAWSNLQSVRALVNKMNARSLSSQPRQPNPNPHD